MGHWQEALDLRKSELAGAYSMARLTAAADIVAAVASATYGVGGDLQLSLPALEQPCLDCLQALCADACSRVCEGSEGALAASSSCLCYMLRMCLQLKYSIEEQVSHMPMRRERVVYRLQSCAVALDPNMVCWRRATHLWCMHSYIGCFPEDCPMLQAARHMSEAIADILRSQATAAWGPALNAADLLYRITPVDLEAPLTAFAENLCSKPTV